jgi:signal transduction histidine kinase
MKIRHRITLWVAGAGLLTSLVFSLVILWEMHDQPLAILDSQLNTVAHTLSKRLATLRKPVEDAQAHMLLVSSERYWVKIYDQDQRLVFQSDLSKAADLPLKKDTKGEPYMVDTFIPKELSYLYQDDDGKVTFRTLVIIENIAGAPYLIQVARPISDFEEEVFDWLEAIDIGLIISSIILMCVSYVLAGRIVRPIAAINQLAREINENTLEKRIPLGKSRDEIFELSECLNQMFNRLQFSFARQKKYLADASHELRSPLTTLRLFFEETSQRTDLPEVYLEQIKIQERNVLRMDRLVKTLLDLSILEIKESLAQELFSLTDLAALVLEDFTPIIERAKIHLEAILPPHIDMMGDEDMIRRVLINLLDNAVKYNTEKGKIQLTLVEKNKELRISVYNTGPGIPEDEREKVLEQFYRVEKSRAAINGGTGLGLAIVKEIVRLHKGKIFIDSVPGSWTRVDISLPQRLENNA